MYGSIAEGAALGLCLEFGWIRLLAVLRQGGVDVMGIGLGLGLIRVTDMFTDTDTDTVTVTVR